MVKSKGFATAEEFAQLKESLEALRAACTETKLECKTHTDTSVAALTSELHSELRTLSELCGGLSDQATKVEGNASTAETAKSAAHENRMRVESVVSSQAAMEERQGQLERALREAEGQASALSDSFRLLERRLEEGLEASRERVRGELADAVGRCRSDAAAHADAAAAQAAAEVREELGATVREQQAELQQGLAASRGDVQSCTQELREQAARANVGLEAASAKYQEALSAAARVLRSEAQAQADELREEARAGLARADRAMCEQRAEHAARAEQLEGELRGCQEAIDVLGAAQASVADAARQASSDHVETRIGAVQEENCLRLSRLEEHTRSCQERSAEASGILTRQVEWRIDRCLQQLHIFRHDDSSPERKWLSPKFEAAGVRDLQLELRLLAPAQQPEEPPLPPEGAAPGSPAAAAGCTLLLWAPAGLQLVFRCFVGTESAVLRHSFREAEPCRVKRLCFLEEQCQQDGSVCVGIEVYEATHEIRKGRLLVRQHLNFRLAELMQSESRGLADMVRRQLDAAQDRKIRRVQWRLEGAAMLRQSFAEDMPVCSVAFQAAGISRAQLVFYPSGCAGAKEGFCSLFLLCPSGCSIRCWLWAGRLRKVGRTEPAEKPDFIGRVNFCRFENIVSAADESIDLAVEIEEAQQTKETTSEWPRLEAPAPSTPPPGAGAAAVPGAPPPPSHEGGAHPDPGAPVNRTDVAMLKVQNSLRRLGSEHVKQLPTTGPGTAHAKPQAVASTDVGGGDAPRDATSGAARPHSSPATAHGLSSPSPKRKTPSSAKGKVPVAPPLSTVAVAGPRRQGSKYKEYLPG